MGNELGAVSVHQAKSTVDLLLGIINPNETIQQKVVIECTSQLNEDFPQATMVYNRHYYYVFMNLHWFKYFLFVLFIKGGLIRDMKKEIKEVDSNFRGLSVFNKLSSQSVNLIRN
jgi:hypothetical protein